MAMLKSRTLVNKEILICISFLLLNTILLYNLIGGYMWNDRLRKILSDDKIIFTDGEASMPDMPIDAIWIVFGNEKINPKGGRVINITGEQLDRLYSYEMDIPSQGRSR